MFGTKSKSWEYENEIRLIYSTSKRKGYNPFALKSIYFGLNMDEKHQIQIITTKLTEFLNELIIAIKIESKNRGYL